MARVTRASSKLEEAAKPVKTTVAEATEAAVVKKTRKTTTKTQEPPATSDMTDNVSVEESVEESKPVKKAAAKKTKEKAAEVEEPAKPAKKASKAKAAEPVAADDEEEPVKLAAKATKKTAAKKEASVVASEESTKEAEPTKAATTTAATKKKAVAKKTEKKEEEAVDAEDAEDAEKDSDMKDTSDNKDDKEGKTKTKKTKTKKAKTSDKSDTAGEEKTETEEVKAVEIKRIQRSGKNPQVWMDLYAGPHSLGKIVIELYTDTPIATENFRSMCTGEVVDRYTGVPITYKHSKFTQLTSSYVTGGYISDTPVSIYNGYFPDEEAGLQRKHTEIGTVSLFSERANRNDSQFVITLQPNLRHLDGQYVVIGKVIQGLRAVYALSLYGDSDGIPEGDCYVSDCGRYKKDKKSTTHDDDKPKTDAEMKAEAEAEAKAEAQAKADADAKAKADADAEKSANKPPCPKCQSPGKYVKRCLKKLETRWFCTNEECKHGYWVPDTRITEEQAKELLNVKREANIAKHKLFTQPPKLLRKPLQISRFVSGKHLLPVVVEELAMVNQQKLENAQRFEEAKRDHIQYVETKLQERAREQEEAEAMAAAAKAKRSKFGAGNKRDSRDGKDGKFGKKGPSKTKPTVGLKKRKYQSDDRRGGRDGDDDDGRPKKDKSRYRDRPEPPKEWVERQSKRADGVVSMSITKEEQQRKKQKREDKVHEISVADSAIAAKLQQLSASTNWKSALLKRGQ